MKKLTTLLFALGALAATAAFGQDITLIDGKIVASKGITKRSGDLLTVRITMEGGGEGEIGYRVSQIAKVNWPEPQALVSARTTLAKGKYKEVLDSTEPVLKFFSEYKDVEGSWWLDTAMLRIVASIGADQLDILGDLGKQLATVRGVTPQHLAKVAEAAPLMKADKWPDAIKICDEVIADNQDPLAVAVAQILKGQCYLGDHKSGRLDCEPALRAFLQVVVFHSRERGLLPTALLGAAKSFQIHKNQDRAVQQLTTLVEEFPDSPQAKAAKIELEHKK